MKLIGTILKKGSMPAKRKGKPPKPSTAKVFATPDPSPAWGRVHVGGCGYVPDLTVVVHVEHATYTEVWSSGMFPTGCFDFALDTAEPGKYGLKVYQVKHKRQVLMAEGSMTVQ